MYVYTQENDFNIVQKLSCTYYSEKFRTVISTSKVLLIFTAYIVQFVKDTAAQSIHHCVASVSLGMLGRHLGIF